MPNLNGSPRISVVAPTGGGIKSRIELAQKGHNVQSTSYDTAGFAGSQGPEK